MTHISVLKQAILAHFATPPTHSADSKPSVLIDCTLGLGGHSLALLESNKDIEIYAFDRDKSAIDVAKRRLERYRDRIHIAHAPFSQALKMLDSSVLSRVYGIIADIGVSSMQLDDESRGFSFSSSALDMRMDKDESVNAMDIINTYPKAKLETIFSTYGEIRYAKRLADVIIKERERAPIASGYDLSNLIERYFAKHTRGALHPATLAFQALRIAVNDELNELECLLKHIELAYNSKILPPCKIGIISFHSLEDRIIKHTFKRWSSSCICEMGAYKCECGNNHALGHLITKKPLIPESAEILQNHRARSAKLRIFALDSI